MRVLKKTSLWFWLLTLSFLFVSMEACVVGSSHPCQSTADCSDGLVCKRGWCLPSWYETGTVQEKPSEIISSDGGETLPEPSQEQKSDQIACGACQPGVSRTCFNAGKKGCRSDGTGCQGECKGGQQICLRDAKGCGSWSACLGAVLPVEETCNGKDDDCDGKTDENLTRSCFDGDATLRGRGVCKEGAQTCKAGQWDTCQGSGKPVDEVCNGKDDNCDGKPDNLAEPSTLALPIGLLSPTDKELLPEIQFAYGSDGSTYFATTYDREFVFQGKTIKPLSQSGKTSMVGKFGKDRRLLWFRSFGTEQGTRVRTILLTSTGKLFVGGVTDVGTWRSVPSATVDGVNVSKNKRAFVLELRSDGSKVVFLNIDQNPDEKASSEVTALASDSTGSLLVVGNFTAGLEFQSMAALKAPVTGKSAAFVAHFAKGDLAKGTWLKALPSISGEVFLYTAQSHPTKADQWLVAGKQAGQFKIGATTVDAYGGEGAFVGWISKKDGVLSKVMRLGPEKISQDHHATVSKMLLHGSQLLLMVVYQGSLEIPLGSKNTKVAQRSNLAIVSLDLTTDQFDWFVAPTLSTAQAAFVLGTQLNLLDRNTLAVTGMVASSSLTWGKSNIAGNLKGMSFFVGLVDLPGKQLSVGFGSRNPNNGLQLFSGVRRLSSGLLEVVGSFDKQFGLGPHVVSPPLGGVGGWFFATLDAAKGWQCP